MIWYIASGLIGLGIGIFISWGNFRTERNRIEEALEREKKISANLMLQEYMKAEAKYNKMNIDAILDKIVKDGIESLTDPERNFLKYQAQAN